MKTRTHKESVWTKSFLLFSHCDSFMYILQIFYVAILTENNPNYSNYVIILELKHQLHVFTTGTVYYFHCTQFATSGVAKFVFFADAHA